MKKFIFTSALISFVVMSHAQWFAGSKFGCQFTSEKIFGSVGKLKEVRSEFSFTPIVGYQKNKFAVGGRIGYVKKNSFEAHGEWLNDRYYKHEIRIRTNRFGIQPFVRYTFVEYGNFSILANVGAHLFSESIRFEYSIFGNSKSGLCFGINLVPVVSYNLSQRISLEASLNFMNLGWNKTLLAIITRYDETKTNFGFGAKSGNVVDVGVISLGFIYKFKNKWL